MSVDAATTDLPPGLAALPLPLAVRIRVPPSPCWIWDGARTTKGYGTFQHTTAHRLVYETVVGPIPDGHQIDHLCKNPTCVNPAHLEAVTQEENNRRSNSSSAQRGRQRACKNGHEFTDENTSYDGQGRRRCVICRNAWMRARYAKSRSAVTS